MTYFRFHLIFNLPLLVALGLLNLNPWTAGDLRAMGLVLLAVLIFTTPWDNLAAKWGIWGFPPGKYSRKIGYLPVEEYGFFILQSLLVMLAVRSLFHFFPDYWLTAQETGIDRWTLIFLGISLPAWLIVAGQLWWLRRKVGSRSHYALHLAWFLPVLYFQWILAPPLIWDHALLLLLVTTVFGIYYTGADLVAVRNGIWFFDENQITGWKLGRILPWEEIAFFLLTSLLVAQSYLLLLPSEQR